MRNLGKKVGFEESTLLAFACSCNCFLCPCISCSNCTSVDEYTGQQILDGVNEMQAYNKSFGPMTIMQGG